MVIPKGILIQVKLEILRTNRMIDPELAKLCDEGEIERYNSDAFTAMARTLTQTLPQSISAKVS